MESCDELQLKTYVSFADTSLVQYPKSEKNRYSQTVSEIVAITSRAKLSLLKIKGEGMCKLMRTIENKNSQATASENLKKDFHFFSNLIVGRVDAGLELGSELVMGNIGNIFLLELQWCPTPPRSSWDTGSVVPLAIVVFPWWYMLN